MALKIRNVETEKLARVVSELTGETKTQAVTVALQERLNRLQRKKFCKFRIQELESIANYCASLPVLDDRSVEEFLKYDKDGLPN